MRKPVKTASAAKMIPQVRAASMLARRAKIIAPMAIGIVLLMIASLMSAFGGGSWSQARLDQASKVANGNALRAIIQSAPDVPIAWQVMAAIAQVETGMGSAIPGDTAERIEDADHPDVSFGPIVSPPIELVVTEADGARRSYVGPFLIDRGAWDGNGDPNSYRDSTLFLGRKLKAGLSRENGYSPDRNFYASDQRVAWERALDSLPIYRSDRVALSIAESVTCPPFTSYADQAWAGGARLAGSYTTLADIVNALIVSPPSDTGETVIGIGWGEAGNLPELPADNAAADPATSAPTEVNPAPPPTPPATDVAVQAALDWIAHAVPVGRLTFVITNGPASDPRIGAAARTATDTWADRDIRLIDGTDWLANPTGVTPIDNERATLDAEFESTYCTASQQSVLATTPIPTQIMQWSIGFVDGVYPTTCSNALSGGNVNPLILSAPALTAEQMKQWWQIARDGKQPASLSTPIGSFIDIVYQEAGDEGVRADVMFAQMVLETGSFTNSDTKISNFAGIAHFDGTASGADLGGDRMGVRTQVQMLKRIALGIIGSGATTVVPPGTFKHPLAPEGRSPIGWLGGSTQYWAKLGGNIDQGDAGWASAKNYWQSVSGVYQGMLQATGVTVADQTTAQTSSAANVPGSVIEKVAYIESVLESGRDYSSRSRTSSASGAYQITDSTWAGWASLVPGADAFAHAADAPPAIQDAVAIAGLNETASQVDGDPTLFSVLWYIGRIPTASSRDWYLVAGGSQAAGNGDVSVAAYRGLAVVALAAVDANPALLDGSANSVGTLERIIDAYHAARRADTLSPVAVTSAGATSTMQVPTMLVGEGKDAATKWTGWQAIAGGAAGTAIAGSCTSDLTGPAARTIAGMLAYAQTLAGCCEYSPANPYRFGEVLWPGGVVSVPGRRDYGPYPAGTRVFDCSGFVTSMYETIGIDLHAISSSGLMGADQNVLMDVPGGQAGVQPGDIIVYGQNDSGVGHVVIALDAVSTIESSPSGVHVGTIRWDRAVAVKRVRPEVLAAATTP